MGVDETTSDQHMTDIRVLPTPDAVGEYVASLVIVLMLWLYLTCYLVLLGAEINAEAEHQTARDTTAGEPRPMGERDAVVADTLPDKPEPTKEDKDPTRKNR